MRQFFYLLATLVVVASCSTACSQQESETKNGASVTGADTAATGAGSESVETGSETDAVTDEAPKVEEPKKETKGSSKMKQKKAH